MKIIKAGNLKPKVKKKTCPECGCIFEYGEKDVKETEMDPRDGYSERYVVCPQKGCKVEITL